jgi:hypothetical protein
MKIRIIVIVSLLSLWCVRAPPRTSSNPWESVGLRINLLQIRLDGRYFAAFLGNRTTIALQNRQNLSSPSRIFASIS